MQLEQVNFALCQSIVDGDIIDVNDVRIRLSMVNTPERGELGYEEATVLTEFVCPVGAEALVDFYLSFYFSITTHRKNLLLVLP